MDDLGWYMEYMVLLQGSHNINTGEYKMRFSNNVKIKPYVGENYNNTSPKLLILGLSAFYGKVIPYTQYPKTKRFFTVLQNIFINANHFWDDVCLYDYVQELMIGPKEKTPPEYFENAKKPFFEILEKLEPDIVMVLGYETYEKIKFYGEGGKTVRIPNVDEIIKIWKYKINGKTVYFGRIKHPSSFGFKKDVWTKLVSKFFKEYEKDNL